MEARRASYGWLRGELAQTGHGELTYDVRVRRVPDTKLGHLEAYVTVARDDCFSPRIGRAYDAVLAYALWVGPAREIYLDYCERLAGTDPFVLVAQPIEE